MTNQIIETAVTAVRTVSDLAAQLAQVSPDAQTESCGVTDDNIAFNDAVASAESAIQLAMDEVCGKTLRALDFALDELRLARQDYFTPVSRNRVNAALHAENALRYMESGPVAEDVEGIEDDTTGDASLRTLRLVTVDGETVH
jgi:hypothetical protein